MKSPKGLKVCCWNCEDFYQYSPQNTSRYEMRHELTDNNIMQELKTADIILLQEWNERNSALFLHYLESFEKMVVDRTAVLYRKGKFTQPKYLEIELLWEKPHVIERAYTIGRVKKNIFAKLLYGTLPIYISCFHLSAYIPDFHAEFHRRQLNAYVNDCLASYLFTNKKSLRNNIRDFCFIIGGDTNLNDGHLHPDLLSFLIPSFADKLGLHDVCQGYCDNTYTQDFRCTHEKGFAKAFWRIKSLYYKNVPSRLDFLGVNMKYTDPKVIKDCYLSDHSLISAFIQMKRVKSSKLQLGYSHKKTKFTKSKRKTKKNKNL